MTIYIRLPPWLKKPCRHKTNVRMEKTSFSFDSIIEAPSSFMEASTFHRMLRPSRKATVILPSPLYRPSLHVEEGSVTFDTTFLFFGEGAFPVEFSLFLPPMDHPRSERLESEPPTSTISTWGRLPKPFFDSSQLLWRIKPRSF